MIDMSHLWEYLREGNIVHIIDMKFVNFARVLNLQHYYPTSDRRPGHSWRLNIMRFFPLLNISIISSFLTEVSLRPKWLKTRDLARINTRAKVDWKLNISLQVFNLWHTRVVSSCSVTPSVLSVSTGCSINIVFFLKMLLFFWTLSVLLQRWCLTCHRAHTLTPRGGQSPEYILKSSK